jgi:hypothetical protein
MQWSCTSSCMVTAGNSFVTVLPAAPIWTRMVCECGLVALPMVSASIQLTMAHMNIPAWPAFARSTRWILLVYPKKVPAHVSVLFRLVVDLVRSEGRESQRSGGIARWESEQVHLPAFASVLPPISLVRWALTIMSRTLATAHVNALHELFTSD